MDSAFTRLAGFISRRSKIVLAVWAVLFLGSVYFASHEQDRLSPGGWDVPGSGAVRSSQALTHFKGFSAPGLGVVVSGPSRAAVEKRVAAARAYSATLPHVFPGPVEQVNKTTVLLPLTYTVTDDGAISIAEKLQTHLEQQSKTTTTAVIGGPAIWAATRPVTKKELEHGESIGFPIIFLILLGVFGTLVAAVAPLALGFVAVVITGALIYWLSYSYSMSLYVTNMASMIGIGVAVDYSLFIVSRFRIELQRGADKLEALGIALRTSGNAVLFSGATVMVSLAGLFLLDMNAMRSMAVGAILVVAVAVTASLTLLPAFLSVVGHNIERLRIPTPWTTGGEAGGDFWRNWTNGVLRRPVISLVVGATIMLILASPVLSISLFTRGLTLLPASSPTHIATERVARAVGPGASGPAHVVTGNAAAAAELRKKVATLRGIARTGPIVAASDRQAFLFEAYFKDDPESNAASATVADIERLGASTAARHSTTVAVGGTASQERSLKNAIVHNLWKLIAFILIASYLILLILLRSVVLPLKAVLMNILSVAAAYGILVAVFQWGWLDWTGYNSPGYIDTIVPALVLAVTFGLSMDYEVFLLTRIKERWIALGDSDAAVSEGVMLCARIISSAALIMVAVFSAFSIAGSIELRQLGVGLAAAVALDATIVRLVIVPSTMKLLGDWNWWLPDWLDRRLPQIGEAPRTRTPLPPLDEPEPSLVVTEGPLAGLRLLLDSELVLGRGKADVVLQDEEVSRRHALIRHANGRLVLYDLGSLNGTWVNGDRVIDEPRTLTVGDKIQLGATTIAVTPPRPALTITNGPLAGRRLQIESELTLGRVDADVALEDDEVSRRHATIRLDGDGLVIDDLGSLNGTWVNGVRIAKTRPLAVGDTIRIGETAIEVTPES